MGILTGSRPKQVTPTTTQILDAYSQPWATQSATGTFTFDPTTQTLQAGLSPALQNLEAATGQSVLEGQQRIDALLGNLVEQYGGYKGVAQGQLEAYGRADAGRLGDIAGGMLTRAQEQALAIQGYDPTTLASSFYEQYVQPGIAKEQEREFLNLENRLLAQGMLGSTGGAQRMEALQTAQGDVRRQAQMEAFNQAQQFQDLMRQRQAQDIQSGATLTGGMLDRYGNVMSSMSGLIGQAGGLSQARTQLEQQGLQNLLNIYQQPLETAKLGIDVGLGRGAIAAGYSPTIMAGSGGLAGGLIGAAGQLGAAYMDMPTPTS